MKSRRPQHRHGTVRYARTVFIAPHWPTIFGEDAERRQTAREAEATHDAMVQAYAELGYDLMPLPQVSVAERAAFVQEQIGLAG